MTPQAGQSHGYGAANRAIGTPRTIEYELFSHVTGRLSRADRDGDFPALAVALHENLQLWTALVVDLADPENGLPLGLKGQLMGLADFTRAHTRKVLARDGEAEVLVAINTAIMRGLRGQLPSPELP